MALTPEEREKIRERIRLDLEASKQSGKPVSDASMVEQFSREQSRLQQIEHVRQEVEEKFYADNPDYVQYVNRYGVSKWVLESELKLKRQRGRARRNAKRQERVNQLRNTLLLLLGVVALYVGYRVFERMNQPPVVVLRANVTTGMVFIDNAPSTFKPNIPGFISIGAHRIGIAAPGFRTAFQKVNIVQGDTNFIDFQLEPDPNFVPDLTGLWRERIPPPRPDEPVVITELRKSRNAMHTADGKPTETANTGQRSNVGVFITSNVSDATIFMNGAPTPLPQNTWLNSIPMGELRFEIRKPGYKSTPSFLSVNRKSPDDKFSLAFELSPENTVAVVIRTIPVAGEIRIDGITIGRGEVTQEPAPGLHTISFGDIPGFVTPAPQKIEISARTTNYTIVGEYRSSVDIEMKVDESGRLKTSGLVNVTTGYWLDAKGTITSNEFGPEIIKIKPYDFYVYQFGPGRPNAVPSGNDFLEVTFNLPTGFETGRPLSLVLEGYATNRNFQFNLTKFTEFAVMVNGETVHASLRPSVNIDENRTVARDSYPIGKYLKAGTNRVTVRVTDNSKCYYLLRGLRIE